jgi:hypothetical protein
LPMGEMGALDINGCVCRRVHNFQNPHPVAVRQASVWREFRGGGEPCSRWHRVTLRELA